MSRHVHERGTPSGQGPAGDGGATVAGVAAILEEFAPPELAEDWDNSGLLLGNPADKPAWVAIALDAAYALGSRALPPSGPGLLVTHHPLPFRPLDRLVTSDPTGRALLELARRRIALYAAHTTYDSAPGGLSHLLALRLGLAGDSLEPLALPERLSAPERFYKLVVFVPRTHTPIVRQTLARAGAGWIGNYSDTAFVSPGTGFFRPREGADPYVGSTGLVEEVAEDRIETIVEARLAGEIVRRMAEVHPYEEPAYDLYPLAGHPPVTRGPSTGSTSAACPEQTGSPSIRLPEQTGSPSAGSGERVVGIGRVDELREPAPGLEALTRRVEEALGLARGAALAYPAPGPAGLPVDPPVDSPVGPPTGRPIRRVAVCPGSGGDYIAAAARAEAEVYITGDLTYHKILEAAGFGLSLIDAGHLGTERLFVPEMAARLRKTCSDQGFSLGVIEIPSPIGKENL